MNAYRRDARTETVQVDDQCVVLHLDRYTVTTLNEVGGYCWSLLGEEQSARGLAEAVAAKYERRDEELAGDIDAFMSLLMECGLVYRV